MTREDGTKLKLLQKKKVIPCQKKHTRSKGYLKDNVQLLTLALPTVILLSIFAYWPMFGIVLAFKDYKVPKGIWGSPWVGFKNFEFFLKSQDAWRVTRNTIVLNLLFIVVGIVCGVIFALIMFEVKKARHVKIYQTVSIIPSFISWVAVGYIVYAMLDPTKGMINQVLTFFGKEGISWYSEPKYWPFILVITKTWQGVGLGSIIYYAALMGVDNELYEAADIDGAGKLQKTWFVSIPQIVPIIIIIDTYVFRALMQQGNLGMSAAVGLFQSVICFVTLMLTNAIIKKKSPENALF